MPPQPGPALHALSHRVAHQVRRSDPASLQAHLPAIDTELREIQGLLSGMDQADAARRGRRAADGGPRSPRRGPDTEDAAELFVSIQSGPDQAPWVPGETGYDADGNLLPGALVDDDWTPPPSGAGHHSGPDTDLRGAAGPVEEPFREAWGLLAQAEQKLAGLSGLGSRSGAPPATAGQRLPGPYPGPSPTSWRGPVSPYSGPPGPVQPPHPAVVSPGHQSAVDGRGAAGNGIPGQPAPERSPTEGRITGSLFDEPVAAGTGQPPAAADPPPLADHVPDLLARLAEVRAPIAERMTERHHPPESRRADRSILETQSSQLTALLGLFDARLTQSTWRQGPSYEPLGPAEAAWHHHSQAAAVALQHRTVIDAERVVASQRVVYTPEAERATGTAALEAARQGLADLTGFAPPR